jgi:hypothetical protein
MNLKYQIEVMQAAMEGKSIQWSEQDSDYWEDVDSPKWNWGAYNYRIKPTVVMVRHYRIEGYIYVAARNFSPYEDVNTENFLADPAVEWLDDWQEAKFGPYEPK